MIQRYCIDYYWKEEDFLEASIEESGSGEYVRYDDHAAVVAEKDAEIARLEEANETLLMAMCMYLELESLEH